MPGSIIGEWILQPLLELLLRLFGDWTGRIVVPVLSLGLIRIEGAQRTRRARPRWHGFHRAANGGIAIDDDTTVLMGLLFWAALGVGAYFALR